MDEISTGQPNNLGTWYDNTSAMFGEDSKATKFLQEKIKESKEGREEKVFTDESQLLMLLGQIHFGDSKKEKVNG